ncbi:MAG: MBL fold metallo-hydrolase [Litoreibacter sp.]|nr:MBL fold metallo-hydrolase [Litoreibacter sp.]
MEDQVSFDPVVGKAEKLAPGIRRVLAPNPSPMTYRGTNTYLIGTRDIAVIDPGPPDEAHLKAILEALEGHQRISHIFVTHSHIDHSPLGMVLAQFTGARVHAFGSSRAGRADIMSSFGKLGGGEGIDETFLPDIEMKHLDCVEGSDWRLRALHTPGHLGNHLCFELDWEADFSGHVFTGDLVMGWATSIVSPPDGHLTDFMSSLRVLQERDGHSTYHPGHGAQIDDPLGRVSDLAQHRLNREAQILHALSTREGSAADIAARIYVDVDPNLLPAAARNVLAHLIDLSSRNKVISDGPLREDAVFTLS